MPLPEIAPVTVAVPVPELVSVPPLTVIPELSVSEEPLSSCTVLAPIANAVVLLSVSVPAAISSFSPLAPTNVIEVALLLPSSQRVRASKC